jgi:hypothetical protein
LLDPQTKHYLIETDFATSFKPFYVQSFVPQNFELLERCTKTCTANWFLKVPEEVLEELTSATKPPAVVHAVTKDQKSVNWELEDRMLDFLIGNKHKKTKETKTFNILDAKPDFENCNGWSLTVDKHSLKSLSDSNIGIFMVNLTKVMPSNVN